MKSLKEGKLYKKPEFQNYYSNTVYLAVDKLNWNTDNNLIFRLKNDTTLITSGSVVRLNYWYELKEEKYQLIFYNCKNIIIPDKSFKSLFNNNLHRKLICINEKINLPRNIQQYKISDTIKHIELQFKSYLNIKENIYNENTDCYFFGLYNLNDLNNIKNHKGNIHLIFGGSDLDDEMNHCKKLIPLLKDYMRKKNIKLYFISKNLKDRGDELNLNGVLVRLNLLKDNKNWQNENLQNIISRNCIYCYTGCNKLGKLYNYELLLEIEKKLPQYTFIYSHKLKKLPEEMKEIYNKCFIGLRLTKKDGNANTVIEMGYLGIPVIFNGEEINSISYQYNNIDDIITKIESVKKLEL